MLKALELVGFKSFADKTRFEFPPGITVIVGPNGSGKSNIVDAIKWVLGEQSAKSLRGKDMADVIFKGSAEGGRRNINTAEATIIFDNTDGRLDVDAPEVHITRRVYRSGEGEYLINRQPCRLKDIRQLVRGTGVGADAYSLIEQGKVDRMLQASPRERRAIFEEAAGISRFKAKKIEAQRRLERVEQNLLRLSDIVEEVGSRLRRVRAQASKARRYRECQQRLQQLRTQVGFADWRRLTRALAEINEQREQAAREMAQWAETMSALQQSRDETAARCDRLAQTSKRREHEASQVRERIASRMAAYQQARLRAGELEAASDNYRREWLILTRRLASAAGQIESTRQQVRQSEAACQQAQQHLAHQEKQLDEITARGESLQTLVVQRRKIYVEQTRALAAGNGRIASLETQRERGRESLERMADQLEQQRRRAAACREQLQSADRAVADSAEALKRLSGELEQAEAVWHELQLKRGEQGEALASLRQRFTATKERAAVLDELERSQEGLAAGVREVLEKARSAEEGPFAEVQGLVADLLQASVDVAPLVDLTLGDRASHVVVSGRQLMDEIRRGNYEPVGRVGFITLEWSEQSVLPLAADLARRPGVVGRLDQLVSSDGPYRSLVRRLLGKAWCVESMDVAFQLASEHLGPYCYVTLTGQLIDDGGEVVAGARSTMAGLIARRSELRALHQEMADLGRQMTQLESELASLDRSVADQQQLVDRLRSKVRDAETRHTQLSANRDTMRERLDQAENQVNGMAESLAGAEQSQLAVEDQLAQAREQHERLEREAFESEQALRQWQEELDEVAAQREQQLQSTTEAKVALAKHQQQYQALEQQLNQLEQDGQERSRALERAERELDECLQRLRQANRDTLQLTSELSICYLQKDEVAAQLLRLSCENEELSGRLQEITQHIEQLQEQVHQAEQRQHRRELEAERIQHDRDTMAQRLREDYDIDISQLEQEADEALGGQRDEAEQEIAELRRKINNIGAVNLDALEELEDLEERFQSLSGQYQDLVAAKEALVRIIHKINTDSRRVFLETLEAIRANFQTLYRRAFGGGRADLKLEEGIDVLEAGVEIITTPPGKPSFNNSLLSGGERALTAVALLLAIFQYRPSPFCVLDEVDAPFDEGNIGRFIETLKGFLEQTRFVIVTHSKKTMTAANTLYGVTMQESGVSKRVSVRFEDVTDDGHILEQAVERDADEQDGRGAA